VKAKEKEDSRWFKQHFVSTFRTQYQPIL